ncbi:MAG: 2-phospho-L-lactate guanylyltransferase [Ktedonobacteraceae bacterium]|nr:2-phospho-L-lactate guanylyltransferase [Ktedonobacteraceae bacterium]
MKYNAIIPVKNLDQAKSRLADYLTAQQRASLMLDMLHHVIATLRASDGIEQVTVVSPDAHVLEQVERWGATARRENAAGHNPALTAAAREELAGETGGLLTISADLPLLQVQDVHALLERSRSYDVVLAPSQEGTGTNALLVHPPLALPYVFGPGSLQRFKQEARRRHLLYTLYSSTGLALDIDTIDDLERYLRQASYCPLSQIACCLGL